VIDMNLYTLFTVRKSDDTVPLADNVPTANFPNLMMLQRNGPWDRLVNLRVGVKKILWE